MKKKGRLATLLLVACLALCGGGTLLSAAADGNVGADKVATSTIEASSLIASWSYGKGDGYTPAWTTDGAKMKIYGHATEAVWDYAACINYEKTRGGQFSIADGKTVSMKIKVVYPDQDTKANQSDSLDFVFYGLNEQEPNGKEIVRFRSWTDSGGKENEDHSFQMTTENWGNPTDALRSPWVVGSPYTGKEFAFEFNTTDLLKVKNKFDTFVRADDADDKIKTALGDISEYTDIYVRVVGDNGFNKPVDVTLTELNGQSLANADGYFTDTVAPILFDNGITDALEAGVAYTLPIYASDLLCAEPVINADFTGIDAAKYTYDAPTKQLTFNEAGSYTIAVTATDTAGNTSAAKNYTFTVSAASVPSITAPTVEAMTVGVWEKVTFPLATVNAGISSERVLKLYKNYNETDPGEPDYTATYTADGFTFTVPVGMESGTYTLEYTYTNSSGSGKATTTASITVAEFAATDWASDLEGGTNAPQGNTLAELTSLGVRIRANDANRNMALGYTNLFSAKDGVSVKVAVPNYKGNLAYANARPQLIVYNPTVYDATTNPGGSMDESGALVDNYLMYGVWLSGGGGGDSATNVYVFNSSYGANTWGICCDCTETGWINNAVLPNYTDGRSFTMSFNTQEYFTSIGLQGEKKTAENASGQVGKAIDALMRKWGDIDILAAAVSVHNENGAGVYDYTVAEVDGVSLASEEGAFTASADPVLYVGQNPEAAVLGDTITLNVFGKDILSAATASLTATPPEGEVVSLPDANFCEVTFEQSGTYSFAFSITGANGKTVTEELTIVVKSKLTEFDLTLASDYADGLKAGDAVTIIDLANKAGVAGMVITLKKPDNQTETVEAGDSVTLAKAGVYTLTYLVYDDATPSRNEATKTVTLNAIDDAKPVITVTGMPESAKEGKVQVPAFTIADDSDCDVTVTLILPDGTRNPVQNGKDGFTFTTVGTGTYKVEVKAVDAYDNEKTEIFEIKVTAAEKKSGCGSCKSAVGGGTFAGLLLLIGALLIMRKTKKANG